jgi:hypothetical protein
MSGTRLRDDRCEMRLMPRARRFPCRSQHRGTGAGVTCGKNDTTASSHVAALAGNGYTLLLPRHTPLIT